jgi:hypothetical protein
MSDCLRAAWLSFQTSSQCLTVLLLMLPVLIPYGSHVEYDYSKGTLSFSSLHLGTLALLGDRTRLLPYHSWSIRPTGGYGGSTAEITLEVRDGDMVKTVCYTLGCAASRAHYTGSAREGRNGHRAVS